MTNPTTLARNANIQDVIQILRSEQARKLDVVAPATTLSVEQGRLIVAGAEAELNLDGVTSVDGRYQPTAIADAGLAERLGIPPGYLRTMREQHLDLYDQNVNGWLRHKTHADKNFLVRAFRQDDNGGPGVLRAFLSDHYKQIEHIDVLMETLTAIRNAGVEVDITSCDLTDRRLYVRFAAPAVQALAPTLLANYRSPFTGALGKDNPIVFAGFEMSNSEVGHGAYMIAPEVVIQVCTNGQTRRSSAIRAQHLGGRLEKGAVVWSEETQQKNLELIGSMTRDAIGQFLSVEWLEAQIAEIEAKSTLEVKKIDDTIKHVATKLRYTEAQQDDILSMFVKGGDTTTGGIMQAVTASAQNQKDADVAADMRADAFEVLDLAVAFNR